MDETAYTPEPNSEEPKKGPAWKKIAIIAAVVLVSAAAVALLCALLLAGSRTTPLVTLEKYANAKEVSCPLLVKDMVGGVEGGSAAKLVRLAAKSDEFRDAIEELEERYEDLWADNRDEYGRNFRIRYKNDKAVEEKLDRDELKDCRADLKALGEDYAALGKALGRLKNGELRDLAEDLGLETKDLKACIECLKTIGQKLRGAEVSEGYALEYLITITGSELDGPEEDDGELTVLKVNGKWVSTQGLQVLYRLYDDVYAAVRGYL